MSSQFILSHFFQCALFLSLGVFPSPLRPLLTPALSAPQFSARLGTRTCPRSARAPARRGTGRDVGGSTGPARPADVTAAAVPSKAQEWEFAEGNTAVTPAARAERCNCAACFGLLGSTAGIAPLAQAAPTPHLLRSRTPEFSDEGNVPTRRGLVRTRLGWGAGKGEGRGGCGLRLAGEEGGVWREGQ